MVANVWIVVFLFAELCVLSISVAVAGMDQQNSQRNHLRDLHWNTDSCHSAVVSTRFAERLIFIPRRGPNSTAGSVDNGVD